LDLPKGGYFSQLPHSRPLLCRSHALLVSNKKNIHFINWKDPDFPEKKYPGKRSSTDFLSAGLLVEKNTLFIGDSQGVLLQFSAKKEEIHLVSKRELSRRSHPLFACL
jgi:hypothetical protein